MHNYSSSDDSCGNVFQMKNFKSPLSWRWDATGCEERKAFTLPQRTLRFNSWIFKSLSFSLLLVLLHQQLILIHSFIQHFMWASETWSESTMMWNGLKFKFTQSVMWDEIDRDIPFAHTYFQQQFSSHLILKWNVKYLMCRWSFVFECCNEPHRSRTYFHYSHRNTARSSRKKSVEIVFNLYDDDNVLDSKNCKNDIVTELISHRKRVKNDVWMSAGSI